MRDLKSNLWKIYLFKFFISFWIIAPILIPFYQSNGLSSTEVFIIQAAFAASTLVFEVPSGYLSDVIGRKRTLIIGGLFLPIGVAFYAFSHSFLYFVMAEIIIGISVSMFSGTDSALLYDTLAEMKSTKNYKEIEGKSLFYERLGGSLASIFGGFVAALSIRSPFYINIVTTLVLIPIALSLKEPLRKRITNENPLIGILRIVKYSFSHSEVRILIIYSSVITTVSLIGLWSYFMYYDSLGLNIALYGIIFAVFQISSGYGSKKAYKLENSIGRRNSLIMILIISIIFVALSYFNSYLMIPFILLNAFIWGFSGPLIYDYVNKNVESHIRATLLSIMNMSGRVFFIILSPLFGRLVDIYSLSSAYLFLGIIFLIIGIPSLYLLRSYQ
ncbi:MAG: MFS transporter [Candidatus Methanofastidiosa archaeon]|jgi:MFS family permease|nr:MFS transporter [Candidatus Methanofastidiosa archaeon]